MPGRDERIAVSRDGNNVVLTLSGDWTMTGQPPRLANLLSVIRSDGATVTVRAKGLGRWDATLPSFLYALQAEAARRDLVLRLDGLPAALRATLDLAGKSDRPGLSGPVAADGFVSRVGLWALAEIRQLGVVLGFLGDVLLELFAPRRGVRQRPRASETLVLFRDAGAGTLGIVSIVTLLVGAILAFVGAVQLRNFGAGILVADLVGIAMARELAAVMTAIVVAGRTGASYAARLAAMQGNEEIDALKTLGISPIAYLVVPRVLALSFMMPLLYIYGTAMGLLGGLLIGIGLLDLSVVAYLEQTRGAIGTANFALGFVKSITFGLLVAAVGCRCGLAAGRSAADVGKAATDAVVISIVGIILLDAIFAVCANALDI
ncbi:MAG: ABC transporter permease [Oceanibaculum nanhaiense]|jgi:phospholipid/cholesterol/gamma-HCH transport system permease protein|uniref:ABC transporter permease n=1 Tax=Oceanibaculum nanhaiense TaxID=1909734 RepID=UPI0032EC5978